MGGSRPRLQHAVPDEPDQAPRLQERQAVPVHSRGRKGVGAALLAGSDDGGVTAGLGPLHHPRHVRAARDGQDDRRPGHRLGREGDARDLRRAQAQALSHARAAPAFRGGHLNLQARLGRRGPSPTAACGAHHLVGPQPRSPLSTTARTIHFWQTRKTARTGAMLRTAAAVTRLYSMKYMFVKLTRPSGQKSSVQVHMNLTITSVARAGLTEGRTTRQKMPSSLAPSMRAASM